MARRSPWRSSGGLAALAAGRVGGAAGRRGSRRARGAARRTRDGRRSRRWRRRSGSTEPRVDGLPTGRGRESPGPDASPWSPGPSVRWHRSSRPPRRSGWRTTAASAETADPLEMSTLLLDPGVDGILVGAGRPPAADERRALGELGALVAAAAHRRPELPVVLAGGMGAELHAFGDVADRLGRVLVGPAAHAGPDGDDLRELLIELALPADDARRALGAVGARRSPSSSTAGSTSSRSGSMAGPAPARGRPRRAGAGRSWTWRSCPQPGSRPPSPTTRWSIAWRPGPLARPTVTACATGCASCGSRRWPTRPARASRCEWRPRGPRSATSRRWTPGMGRATGRRSRRRDRGCLGRDAGAVRRPGAGRRPATRRGDTVRARSRPHARAARLDRRIPASAGRSWPTWPTTSSHRSARWSRPAGLRHGRNVGALHLHGANGTGRGPDLRSGSLELVRPAAGQHRRRRVPSSTTPVRLGGRGRHFAIDVTGGLGGLMVDLRDVPLRLPDRADLRSEMLEAWQAAVVAGRGATSVTDRAPVRCPARGRRVRSSSAPVDVVFRLTPGDRPLVAAGDSVVVGAPIAERVRDPSLEEVHVPATRRNPQPGGRWSGPAEPARGASTPGSSSSRGGTDGGSPAARSRDPLETPIAGHRPRGPTRDLDHGPCCRPRAARDRCPGWTDARAAAGQPGQRAACRRSGRELGRSDPRRRLARRCRDPDPGASDGRPRRRRHRPVEQGTPRLPRVGGASALGAAPAATVRGARARRRGATTGRGRRAGAARCPGRSRGRAS